MSRECLDKVGVRSSQKSQHGNIGHCYEQVASDHM